GELRYGNGVEFWNNAHDTLVEGCRLWEIYDAALTTQGIGESTKVNQIFRNNVVWRSEYCFEFWNHPASAVSDNIHFVSNTCAFSGFGWGHEQRFDPSGRHICLFSNTAQTTNLSIRNNIFFRATSAAIFLTDPWTGLDSLVLDHNSYHQGDTDGLLADWLGRSFRLDEFSAYQAETGKDPSSLASDPLFVAADAADFHLAPRSPCIDAGFNEATGLATTDAGGQPRVVHEVVDMGAYERQAGFPATLLGIVLQGGTPVTGEIACFQASQGATPMRVPLGADGSFRLEAFDEPFVCATYGNRGQKPATGAAPVTGGVWLDSRPVSGWVALYQTRTAPEPALARIGPSGRYRLPPAPRQPFVALTCGH
ncbi:MAG: choice-of-anchor Q domain-containing protein, partial [Thermodesulfobacteriota bacterium]